ncbi:MAG: ion transporter [Actinomycetota bacterium]|nr:ion transporter [Actinomycetota bacterium]
MIDRDERASEAAAVRIDPEPVDGHARGVIVERLARISRLDLFMLVLALFSVCLLLWIFLADVDPETQVRAFRVDVAICVVFALEFGWRWRLAGWRRDFIARNWYEVLGMIPVSHPALRSFRLLRVVRVVVVLARLGKGVDRAFGEQYTIRLLARFSDTIVEAVKRPITVAVLDEVGDVLKAGHYTKNLAEALAENRSELQEMVLEKLRQDPLTGRFRVLPFHDRLVDLVSETTMRVMFEVLEDPRTDELVADILRENVEQIRLAVRNKELLTPPR